METGNATWAIVLAAGEGSRLYPLTTTTEGIQVPKQYCALKGSVSLLKMALRRAEKVVDPKKIIVIVSARHQKWWDEELKGYPRENIIVQPKNKGTAVGILLSLLHIWIRERQARVLIVPSDHYIRNEALLSQNIRHLITVMKAIRRQIILLGMTAETPETGYGWIIPAHRAVGFFRPVESFVEKPSLPVAQALLSQGALWNSFMFLGWVNAFLDLYAQVASELLHAFLFRGGLSALDQKSFGELSRFYGRLPYLDFSKDLLEAAPRRLLVYQIPPCGWSDLGTPERISAVAETELRLTEAKLKEVLILPQLKDRRVPLLGRTENLQMSL